MTRAYEELAYWEKAAEDPDVAIKYISDIDLDLCLDAIVPALKPSSILEIGCGIGRLTSVIALCMPESQIHGIDISDKMISLAPKDSVKYRVTDGRKIPYPDESFDSVYSMLVFQHIPTDAKISYIKEAARVLKSGGIFRVQFVIGDHHANIDHGTTMNQMLDWIAKAGFATEVIENKLIHPQWGWITGVKNG